ncbi:Cellulose synthase operon protein C precursor [Vibrio thalassae]|uniref:Cellulose synthase operon protein C n=1 Tax=Vibrio thalassae TaxID=1243014 RepID=A0A240E969_9VIBR|nr:cellulose synthase subunit BcsC-related outer membrane protein [Vibrio thalassae]SNX45277.1 Cellulose synthase operon protein C precursor [Vibrio thalassae]
MKGTPSKVAIACLTIFGASAWADDIPAAFYRSAPDWLENQIVIGELKQDEALVEGAVERWLAIAPQSPEALFAQSRWYVRNNQVQKAETLFRELDKEANPELAEAFGNYLALHTSLQDQYNQALLLERGGQNKAAFELFEKLYGDKRPDMLSELDYLGLKSTFPEYQQEVLEAYQQLDKEFPDVGEIRIGLARHLARYGRESEALAIYRDLANDSRLGVFASTLWMAELQSEPMSEEWFDTYELIASYHSENLSIQQQYETAKQRWEREKTLRKDPIYRGKLAAFERIEKRQYDTKTLKALQAANRKYPDDPEILLALGRYYYHNNDYQTSIRYFEQAQKFDDSPDLVDFYQSELRSIRFWQALDLARRALSAEQYSQAIQQIDLALSLDNKTPVAHILKGRIYLAQKRYRLAHQSAEKALTLEPLNSSALQLWVQSYAPEKANAGEYAALQTLTKQQKAQIAEYAAQVEHLNVYERFAGSTTFPEQDVDFRTRFRTVLESDAYLPWTKKNIAEQLLRLAQPRLADKMMFNAYQRHKDGEHTHAYALYLSGQGRWDEAFDIVSNSPAQQLTSSELATYSRIKLEHYRQHIAQNGLRGESLIAYIEEIARQDRPSAIVLWSQTPYEDRAQAAMDAVVIASLTTPELELMSQAAFDIDNGDFHQAIYQEAKRRKVLSISIQQRQRLFDADELLARKETQQASEIYIELLQDGLAISQARMDAWFTAAPEYVEPVLEVQAQRVFDLTDEQVVSSLSLALESNNQPYINFFNNHLPLKTLNAFNYWQLQEASLKQSNDALTRQYSRQALLLDDKERLGLTRVRDIGSAYLSAEEHWMTNDIIATLDRIDERYQSYFIVGGEYNNVPGGSKYLTVPFELGIAMPEWDGRLKLRTDSVYLNSGSLTYYDTNVEFERDRVGQAFSVGWEADNWRADFGTTPIGFRYTDWVGGIEGVTEWGDVTLRGNLSKRPVTASLISYSGLSVTERNGITTQFGGVTRSGATVSASWNDGRPYGVWGYLEYHQLSGNNVADNDRTSGMLGSYYNFISNDEQAFSLGGTMFYMGYDKNVNEVIIGYGKYYSPQSYVSLAVPISYYRRHSFDWTYGVRGTVSFSNASFDAPYNIPGGTSSSSQGVSAGLQLYTEYRVNEHWSFVGYMSQQFSSDYQPSVFNVYLKYHFDANWRKARLQPDPLRLYADYF